MELTLLDVLEMCEPAREIILEKCGAEWGIAPLRATSRRARALFAPPARMRAYELLARGARLGDVIMCEVARACAVARDMPLDWGDAICAGAAAGSRAVTLFALPFAMDRATYLADVYTAAAVARDADLCDMLCSQLCAGKPPLHEAWGAAWFVTVTNALLRGDDRAVAQLIADVTTADGRPSNGHAPGAWRPRGLGHARGCQGAEPPVGPAPVPQPPQPAPGTTIMSVCVYPHFTMAAIAGGSARCRALVAQPSNAYLVVECEYPSQGGGIMYHLAYDADVRVAAPYTSWLSYLGGSAHDRCGRIDHSHTSLGARPRADACLRHARECALPGSSEMAIIGNAQLVMARLGVAVDDALRTIGAIPGIAETIARDADMCNRLRCMCEAEYARARDPAEAARVVARLRAIGAEVPALCDMLSQVLPPDDHGGIDAPASIRGLRPLPEPARSRALTQTEIRRARQYAAIVGDLDAFARLSALPRATTFCGEHGHSAVILRAILRCDASYTRELYNRWHETNNAHGFALFFQRSYTSNAPRVCDRELFARILEVYRSGARDFIPLVRWLCLHTRPPIAITILRAIVRDARGGATNASCVCDVSATIRAAVSTIASDRATYSVDDVWSCTINALVREWMAA